MDKTVHYIQFELPGMMQRITSQLGVETSSQSGKI